MHKINNFDACEEANANNRLARRDAWSGSIRPRTAPPAALQSTLAIPSPKKEPDMKTHRTNPTRRHFISPFAALVKAPLNGCLSVALFSGAILLLCAARSRAASDIHFGPTATEASVSNPDGTWINMWGGAWKGTTFDATNPPPSGDTAGSPYVQGDWTGDTSPSGMDSYNMISPGTWWGNVVFDGTAYASIELDIKYDTNSTMTPTSAAQLSIGLDTGYHPVSVTNISFDIASSALANGAWHHLSIPIPAATVGIGSSDGVSFYRWNPPGTSGTMSFWMANVVLVARAGNPVTYSFTIAGYPTSFNCEAYLFLVPNPAAVEEAPDWNETNCAQVVVQGSASRATMRFRYKINEDHQQAMAFSGTPKVGGGTGTTLATSTTFAIQKLIVPEVPGGFQR